MNRWTLCLCNIFICILIFGGFCLQPSRSPLFSQDLLIHLCPCLSIQDNELLFKYALKGCCSSKSHPAVTLSSAMLISQLLSHFDQSLHTILEVLSSSHKLICSSSKLTGSSYFRSKITKLSSFMFPLEIDPNHTAAMPLPLLNAYLHHGGSVP